mmetsp:Transcript_28140/g.90927  ORF Transcript_28140/g.90927 Transcript_28140/m.90927 type:complete len:219 (-) Transcript_28140:1272-1928(-)
MLPGCICGRPHRQAQCGGDLHGVPDFVRLSGHDECRGGSQAGGAAQGGGQVRGVPAHNSSAGRSPQQARAPPQDVEAEVVLHVRQQPVVLRSRVRDGQGRHLPRQRVGRTHSSQPPGGLQPDALPQDLRRCWQGPHLGDTLLRGAAALDRRRPHAGSLPRVPPVCGEDGRGLGSVKGHRHRHRHRHDRGCDCGSRGWRSRCVPRSGRRTHRRARRQCS